MTPDDAIPAGIDPQKLHDVLGAVHDQVVTALWLSGGMALAFCSIAAIALRRRRTALAFGLLYSMTLCFVRNGHARLLGPAGCAVAVTGLVLPLRRNRDRTT
jgi:4-amino-4-deoxy-L-arabinose transferase-like glycosyltransferase